MIFQEPMSSLNPVFTVGAQIAEVLVLHMKHEPRAGAPPHAGTAGGGGHPEPAHKIDAIRASCRAASSSA
jgi:peptide/nickel transport system ATP-binding protein